MKKLIILLVIPFLVPSCSFENNEENTKTLTSEEEIIQDEEKEVDASQEFKTEAENIISRAQVNLLEALTGAIEKNGIAYAVSYCNEHAQELTSEVIDNEKFTISRVSHKPRNPGNNASEEELKIIQSYIESLEKDITLEPIVRSNEISKTFYAPLLLGSPLCLNCHGEVEKEIQIEDFIAIQMLYPRDKAVDFKLGELRGLWKVTFSKETAPSI